MGCGRGRRSSETPGASSQRAEDRGRSPRRAAVCLLGAVLAAGAAGCGAQQHPNEHRPQPPTRVSVSVTEHAVTVQPPRIAIGPEPTQQIPQNQHAAQTPVRSNAPLSVALVAANLTGFESRLEVRGPGKHATSEPLVANGNGTLQVELPTGVYTISAADIPAAKPAKLTVGPYRTSSQNDLLLP
jgi:hypothetical protein